VAHLTVQLREANLELDAKENRLQEALKQKKKLKKAAAAAGGGAGGGMGGKMHGGYCCCCADVIRYL
jgi:glycerate kinase